MHTHADHDLVTVSAALPIVVTWHERIAAVTLLALFGVGVVLLLCDCGQALAGVLP